MARLAVGHAVHPWHTQIQIVVGGEGAYPEECGNHGYLGLLGQLAQLFVGMGNQHAVAREDDRAFGFIDQFGGFRHVFRVAIPWRVVPRQVYVVWPDKFGLVA